MEPSNSCSSLASSDGQGCPISHAWPLQHILTPRSPAARLFHPSAAAAAAAGRGIPPPLHPPPAWEGHEPRGEVAITARWAYGKSCSAHATYSTFLHLGPAAKPPLPCAASGNNLIAFLLFSNPGRPPTWRKMPSQPAGCPISCAQPTPPVVHLCTWSLQPSHPCHVSPLATTLSPCSGTGSSIKEKVSMAVCLFRETELGWARLQV